MAVSSGKHRIIANNTNIRDIVKQEIAINGTNADLYYIDVKEVTDMSFLFYEVNFNGDISNWNVSNVKYMISMFAHSSFDGDLSKWDVSNVQCHNNCFEGSPLENQPNKQPKFNP